MKLKSSYVELLEGPQKLPIKEIHVGNIEDRALNIQRIKDAVDMNGMDTKIFQ